MILLLLSAALALPPTLSKTGFHEADKREYAPKYPLWSDGADKRRWISLPSGTTVDTEDFDRWSFPAGTRLWKEFSIGGKKVETRLMEKGEDGAWKFGAYVWNEAQTEAELAPPEGLKDHYPIQAGVKHDIPSVTQCKTCHQGAGDRVLGFEAVQLADAWETTKPLLSSVPPKFQSHPPQVGAAVGYLHANCGSCHNPEGKAGYTGSLFRHSVWAESEADSPTLLTNLNQLSLSFVIPGVPETYRVKAGDPGASSTSYRMALEGPGRMPPIGSEIVDNEGVRLITEWIRQLR